MSDAIKRLRGLVNGPGGLGAIEINEVRVLLDIAEAAHHWTTMPFGFDDAATIKAHDRLVTALAKLEAP